MFLLKLFKYIIKSREIFRIYINDIKIKLIKTIIANSSE